MDDLISRQAAIDAILAIKDYGNSDRANALGLAECAVTTLPSVQPQRMRGRWIEDGYNDEKAVCDQCGEPCATYIMGEPRDKYCKWCGAEMRGEPNEVD